MAPRWRLSLIGLLLLIPVILLVGVGLWNILRSGTWHWLPWTIPACWGAAWLLLRGLRRTELPVPETGSRVHWTPQDHAAVAILNEQQVEVDSATADQLIDVEYYKRITLNLGHKLSRHYHPDSTDPIGSLSVVELLTLAHLVSEDLEAWFQTYVPGSHLITVSQWRTLGRFPDVWSGLSTLGTLASVLLDPGKIPRQLIMRGSSNTLMTLVRSNSLGAFCRFYIQRVGYYLIELNSGRLRGGSPRYRRTMGMLEPPESKPRGTATAPPSPRAVTVTIAVIGQAKAGKSSLINCLLGDRQAAVDCLPLTREVTRYSLTGSSVSERESDRLVLLDTPGYSDAGLSAAEKRANQAAVREADLVLLVMAANSPAKQADKQALDDLRQWFETKRELKPPPVIGVVSKIDALSPVMEWAPPYDWESPSRPKEHSVAGAVQFVQDVHGPALTTVVPVATDQEHQCVYGVEEFLLPALTLQLGDARAVSLVRSLHHDYDHQKLGQVMSQLMQVGRRIQEAVCRP